MSKAERARSKVAKATVSSHISGYSLPRLVTDAEYSAAAESFKQASTALHKATQEHATAQSRAANAYSLPIAEIEKLLGIEVSQDILQRIHGAVCELRENILGHRDGTERKRQSRIKLRPDGTRNQSLPEILKLAESMHAAVKAWRAAANGSASSMWNDFAAEASENRKVELDHLFTVLERESLMLNRFVQQHYAELRRDVHLLHQPYARFICALYEVARSAGVKPTVTRNTATRTAFTRFVMATDEALPHDLRRRLDEGISFPSYICDVIEAHKDR